MNRKSFTAILVGGALAGGCSKPNPLFLDTWDVITDSGSVSQTSAVTLETTTIEPPTTTSDPPVTTTSTSTSPSTITSSSDNTTTTTEPNPTTETTGEGFVCDGLDVDMEGCCEVMIEVEADTFFSDAIDGVGMAGCPIAQPEDNPALECRHVSFGSVPEMAVFKDNGVIGAAVIGSAMVALRFPMQDGQLVVEDHGPIPNEQIQSVKLKVEANYKQVDFKNLRFTMHGLGVDGWEEGDGQKPVSCVGGLVSFACLACGPVAGGECESPWKAMAPSILAVLEPLGVVEADEGENSGLAAIDLAPLKAPTGWVPKIAGGLVMEPLSSEYQGMAYEDLMPLPGVTIGTIEGSTPAHLQVRVCKP
ncbi:hypothetical protein [Nannocystis pusilla]|uniref:hypothetical protein n=1 Tax=Nannocystis pusilla TaxID=889268 RepID=UPI003BF2F467